MATTGGGGDTERRRWERWVAETHFARRRAGEADRKLSTVDNYRGCAEAFRVWGTAMGRRVLPATPDVLAIYLTGRQMGLEKRPVLTATALQNTNAIKAFHTALAATTGIPYDPTSTGGMPGTVKGWRKTTKHERRGKIPIPSTRVEQELCKAVQNRFVAHHKLVTAILFGGILRVGAALQLRWGNSMEERDVHFLRWNKEGSPTMVTKLVIRKDKTQEEGEQSERFIVEGALPGGFQLGRYIWTYVHATQLPPGQLLAVPMTTTGEWRRCTRRDVDRIAREVYGGGPTAEAEVASHSFRKGAAQWLREMGVPEVGVKDMGYWASDAFLGYTGIRMDRCIRRGRTVAEEEVKRGAAEK
jgi:integrase